MTRNILFASSGLLIGFMIGFFFANVNGKAPGSVATAGSGVGTRSAPPLDPSKSDGSLPPGHPSLDETGKLANNTASSPQAQSAMEAADRDSHNFEAQMTAAAIFYGINAYDKAAFYLQRALTIKPADTDALIAMGDTKYDSGDYTSAASFYQRALAQQPDNPDVRTDLGNTYYRRQPPDYDRAIAEYRKALALDPRHEKTLENLAAAALQKGDKAMARDAGSRLASVNPSSPALSALKAQLE